MKAYVLAAGYGTRLGALARSRAKPLLEVASEPVLTHSLRQLQGLEDLTELVVITNARFRDQFLEWSTTVPADIPIRVLNDGTTRVEERLGALRDLALALTRVPPGDEAFLVVAGDNLIAFDLRPAARAFAAGNRPLLLLRPVPPPDSEPRYNEVFLDPDGRVVRVREKPPDPQTGVTAIAVYFFTPGVRGLLEEYLASASEHDAPGHFLSWLVERTPVEGHFFEGAWYDAGSIEGLREARRQLATTRPGEYR